jgi:hypothetical protein
VRPEKADVFSGSQSRRGKSQSPVTRMAAWREIETLKPIDQAIGRMVSESPGRNESERTGGPEKLKPRRPSLTVERRRQYGTSHLADAAGHSGGVIATARDQDTSSNWRSPPRPIAKATEPGPPYNQRWEMGGRREGGGWVRSSGEAG